MTVYQWMQLIISCVTLVTIIIGVVKMVYVTAKGVIERENRLRSVEGQVGAISQTMGKINSLEAKMDDMRQELERMRNRLDRFLDIQATKEK